MKGRPNETSPNRSCNSRGVDGWREHRRRHQHIDVVFPERQELFHAGGNVSQRAGFGGDVEPESVHDVQRAKFFRVVEQSKRVVREP